MNKRVKSPKISKVFVFTSKIFNETSSRVCHCCCSIFPKKSSTISMICFWNVSLSWRTSTTNLGGHRFSQEKWQCLLNVEHKHTFHIRKSTFFFFFAKVSPSNNNYSFRRIITIQQQQQQTFDSANCVKWRPPKKDRPSCNNRCHFPNLILCSSLSMLSWYAFPSPPIRWSSTSSNTQPTSSPGAIKPPSTAGFSWTANLLKRQGSCTFIS